MDQQHILVFLSGATALGIIGHAVNTFPTPANKYGAWFIGILQYAVGQRQQALNTLNGQSTITASVSRATAEVIKAAGMVNSEGAAKENTGTGAGAGSAREL